MTVDRLSWGTSNELENINAVLRLRIKALEAEIARLKTRSTEDFFDSILESIRKAKIDVTIRPN